MSERSALPIASAVLLADSIITEAGTNKKTLVGLFSAFFVPSVPFQRELHFYIELTDAGGEYDFLLEILHLESSSVVAGGRLEHVVARDRLTSIEMVIHLPVRFPDFGTYELRLSYKGRVFASRTFRVLEAKQRKGVPSSGGK
ncbi:MAG: hypothetical protein V1918_04075 [Planctomycetota bacterium]